jgi:hypothetical protein
VNIVPDASGPSGAARKPLDPARGGRRRTTLERAAVATGAAWAASFMDDLKKQGRPVAGGWPGTLSEARARIVARMSVDLGRRYQLSPDELELMTRTAYLHAKGRWQASAVADLG